MRRVAGLALVLLVAAAEGQAATPFPLAIGTGGVTGIYYQIGAALCRLLRDHPPAVPIDCSTEGTAGSADNVERIAAGALPLGLAQGDTLRDAVTGEGAFAGKPLDGRLRALFSPVVETFLVLTTARNWVPRVSDLRGRRINIGPPASGSEITFHQMMRARGWQPGDFGQITTIRSSLQAQALCGGLVDAVAFVAANPVPVMQEATFVCAARLVPLDREFASSMIEKNRAYVPAVVAGGVYPNNPDPTPTIGVRGVVIASADLPDEIAYIVTRTLFTRMPEFRTLHLAFAHAQPNELVDQCMFAEVHPGAARYYREAGLTMPRRCLR